MSFEQVNMKQENPGLTDEMFAMFITHAIELCVTDGWTAVAINCYTDGKTHDETEACDALLTPAQKARLDKDGESILAQLRVADDHGCAAALAISMPLQRVEIKRLDPSMSDELLAKFDHVMLQNCRRNRWSPLFLGCLHAAKVDADLAKCKLTKAQEVDLKNDLSEVVLMAKERASPRPDAGL